MDFFRIKLASVEIIHDGDCLNSGHADQASAQSAGIDFLGSSTVRVCHLPPLWGHLDCHEHGTTLARY